MSQQMIQKTLFILGGVAVLGYLLATLIGDIRMSEFGTSTTEPVLWRVVLVAGSLLLIAGLWLVQRSPWAGAGLISLGAVAGAVPIFWTVFMPLVALALVVLSVVNARKATAPVT